MLSNVGLSKCFWAEAVNTACYLVNRSPSISIDFKTSEGVWSATLANYSHLRVFGCPAYFHVNDGKLEPRAKKGIFLGYATGVKGYRLWFPDPKSPKFVISRDVTFDENYMFQSRNESVVDITGSGEEASKQVSLKANLQKECRRALALNQSMMLRFNFG